MKKYIFGIIYGLLLCIFTAYVVLDTFVIPHGMVAVESVSTGNSNTEYDLAEAQELTDIGYIEGEEAEDADSHSQGDEAMKENSKENSRASTDNSGAEYEASESSMAESEKLGEEEVQNSEDNADDNQKDADIDESGNNEFVINESDDTEGNNNEVNDSKSNDIEADDKSAADNIKDGKDEILAGNSSHDQTNIPENAGSTKNEKGGNEDGHNPEKTENDNSVAKNDTAANGSDNKNDTVANSSDNKNNAVSAERNDKSNEVSADVTNKSEEMTQTKIEESGISKPVKVDSYADGGININIYEMQAYDTLVHVADVSVSSPNYLKTALAQNTYGRNIAQLTSTIANAHNAILAVNGDFYGAQEKGYVIRGGVLYRNESAGSKEDLVIYADGTLGIINESQITAEELVAAGVVNTLSFGPALVKGGGISVNQKSTVGKELASNPRSAIGMVGPLHYMFVVSDGRTIESKGLSLYQLAEVMKSLGNKVAYNLDGGGSSSLCFRGNVINKPTTNGVNIAERGVSDIVYIGYE